MATRAGVSVAWYTWLEQGRGGSPSDEVLERLQHALAGPITLEYSAFSVDGGDGLRMVVYTPASPADARAIALLLSDRFRTA